VPDALLERDIHISALRATLEDARAGKAAVAFVLGEAGLGKTALLELAISEAGKMGFECARAQGEAAEVVLPFGYISQLFPEEAAEEVRSFVAKLPPQERATAAWQRLRAWSVERPREPLLVALDDLQWADRDSATLVALLARERTQSRLAVVAGLRPWPGEAAQMAKALAASRRATLIRLTPLTSSASLELVARRTGPATSNELAPRLDEMCAGNPLLLHELCSQVSSPVPAEVGSSIPDAGSHGILLARFTGLDEAGLKYAKAAAISGVQFRCSVAGKVAGLDETEALAALEALCRAGLVRSTEPGRAAFTHALLRQALCDDLPLAVQAEIHAATFRQLAREKAPAGEVAAHVVAAKLRTAPALRTLTEAGTEAFRRGALQAAVDWFRAAASLGGDRCPPNVRLKLAEALDGSGAPDQAADVCRAILDDALPDGAIPDGIGGLDAELAAKTERMLGRTLFELGRSDEAEDAFERAAVLAYGATPQMAIEILLEASLVSLYGSGVRRSFLFADRAEQLLGPSTDRQLAAWVRAARGHARALMAEPGGVEEVDQAIASLPPGTGLRGLHGAAIWGPRLVQLQTAKQAERFQEAMTAYEIAMEEAKRSPVRLSASIYAVAHADTVARLGRIAESRDILLAADDDSPWLAARRPWVHVGLAYTNYQLAEEAKARYYCEQVEAAIGADLDTLPLLRFWLWSVRCRIHLDAGEPGAAARLVERAERASDAAGVVEPCFPWHSAAIEAYLATRRLADAERCVVRLERLCTRVPCLWPRTVAARGRAQLAEQAGERDAAERWFEQALAWQQHLPMPLVKVETLTNYGAFLRRGREASKARGVLREAVRIAADCGARRLEMAATEELHLTGGRRRTRTQRGVWPVTVQRGHGNTPGAGGDGAGGRSGNNGNGRGDSDCRGDSDGSGGGGQRIDHTGESGERAGDGSLRSGDGSLRSDRAVDRSDDWASRLTPAQTRVAMLASQGLTNKEIARRLVISEKTVEHHLGSVYAALGISGRWGLRDLSL
jgi:tetratricopeptide (TPR) repeat protein